jgi:hypothetical protein
MRESIGAFALIRTHELENTCWLAHWNQGWESYNFVGGRKRPDESFRECVTREICEELRLNAGTDFRVSRERAGHFEYVAWSERWRETTAYTIEAYRVEFCSADVARSVTTRSENRWLSRDEIRRCLTDDSQAVSKTMDFILSKIEVGLRSTKKNQHSRQ